MAQYRKANGQRADHSRNETIVSDRAPERHAAKRFNRQSQRTARENVAPPPMRGGIRL